MKATFLLADAHEVEDIQFEYIKIKSVQTKESVEAKNIQNEYIQNEYILFDQNITYRYVVQRESKVRGVMCELGFSVE